MNELQRVGPDADEIRLREIEAELRKPRRESRYWREPAMQDEYLKLLERREERSDLPLAPRAGDATRRGEIEAEMRKGRDGAYWRKGSFMPDEYHAILERETTLSSHDPQNELLNDAAQAEAAREAAWRAARRRYASRSKTHNQGRSLDDPTWPDLADRFRLHQLATYYASPEGKRELERLAVFVEKPPAANSNLVVREWHKQAVDRHRMIEPRLTVTMRWSIGATHPKPLPLWAGQH